MSCIAKPQENDAKVKYNDKGQPVVYWRRWFVLFAHTFGSLMWNFEWARYGPITAEYALYYDTTNEFSPSQNELGVDFLTLMARLFTLLSYPISGYLIDKYGLKMITVGCFGQAVGCWLFYLAMDSLKFTIFARCLTAAFGPLIYGSVLRITAQWFPATERVFAIAATIFLSTLGGSFALLIPPLYKTSDEQLHLELKSCTEDFKEDFFESGLPLNTTECITDADDAFCCAADTDIAGVNFLIAVLTTVGAFYALLVVKDSPPTPPAISGLVKSSMGFAPSLKHVFTHWNYVWMNIADFLASGVALVVYNTISRIFPSSVSDLAIYVSSGALPLAIPMSYFFSWYIGRTGDYYGLSAKCYYLGFVCWWLATIGIAVGGFGDYLVLIGATAASLLYLLWQVAVFEVKLEYVFVPDYALQGTVVAVDRCMINIASLSFILAIPPERKGRLFTFLVGGAIFTVAVLIIAFLPDKRRYLRTAYEKEQDSRLDEEKAKTVVDVEVKAEVEELTGAKEGKDEAVTTQVDVEVVEEAKEEPKSTEEAPKEQETVPAATEPKNPPSP